MQECRYNQSKFIQKLQVGHETPLRLKEPSGADADPKVERLRSASCSLVEKPWWQDDAQGYAWRSARRLREKRDLEE